MNLKEILVYKLGLRCGLEICKEVDLWKYNRNRVIEEMSSGMGRSLKIRGRCNMRCRGMRRLKGVEVD
jgi:hypothetical protein